MKKKIFLISSVFLIFPIIVLAHQPRISNQPVSVVDNPEISKAYYSKLSGGPQVYKISSDNDFVLYINILVPDVVSQKKDFKVTLIKEEDLGSKNIVVLDGNNFVWTKFFEPYGHDTYFKGPEYKAKVSAGEYSIIVSNDLNDSKYALAIGEKENFNFKETMNALRLVPKLKNTFFDKSPAGFIFSPFGWGLLVTLSLFVIVIYFPFRFLLKKYFKSFLLKIKNKHYLRIIEFLLGLGLLLLSIFTSWNIWLLLLAISLIFESIFWV